MRRSSIPPLAVSFLRDVQRTQIHLERHARAPPDALAQRIPSLEGGDLLRETRRNPPRPRHLRLYVGVEVGTSEFPPVDWPGTERCSSPPVGPDPRKTNSTSLVRFLCSTFAPNNAASNRSAFVPGLRVRKSDVLPDSVLEDELCVSHRKHCVSPVS
jgi:hypothetical protein